MLYLLVASAFAGPPLRSAVDGFQLTLPDGWKAAEQQGTWLLGSDTEAGLVVLSYTPGLGVEAMRQQAAAGLTNQGLVLTPTAPPSDRTIGSAKAVVADFRGVAADGTEIRAHGVGLAGPRGGLVALGLTTTDQIAHLAVRVDALVATTTFFAPEVGAVGALSGTVCSWSGGQSYSSTHRLSFDGQGHVRSGSELVGGGELRNGLGDTTATWSAISGDQGQDTGAGTYAIEGDQVVIRWPGGGEQRCAIHQRQADGRITELQCGAELYGAPLCG